MHKRAGESSRVPDAGKAAAQEWAKVPRADTRAALPRREVVPRPGKLPLAALALARLIGEVIGERIWREALTAVEGEAIAEDASQSRTPEPRSPGAAGAVWAARGGQIHATGAARLTKSGLD
jgi:hypothetical protein